MNDSIWNGKNNTICLTYYICCTLTEGHYLMFDSLIILCAAQHPYDGTSCPTRKGSSVNNNTCTMPDPGTAHTERQICTACTVFMFS